MKKFSAVLLKLGAALLVIALIWWYRFFSGITAKLSMPLSDAYSCLYSNDGACAFATGFATLTGQQAYSPTLFWIAVVLLIVGLIIRASLASPRS